VSKVSKERQQRRNHDRYDPSLRLENDEVWDYFRIVKGGVAPVLPAAPSGLSAVAVSRTQINISWTDNSQNENGFRIERSKNVGYTNLAAFISAMRRSTG